MRIVIKEEERTSITSFHSGLNLEIKNKVELLAYRDLNEWVQLWEKVEQQIKRKYTFTKDYHLTTLKKTLRGGLPSKSIPRFECKVKEKYEQKNL